jgi:DNA primase
VRDRSKVNALVRELSRMLGGYDEAQILDEVRRAARRGGPGHGAPGQSAPRAVGAPRAVDAPGPSAASGPSSASAARREVPDPRERRFTIERDVLKLAVQAPAVIATCWPMIEPEDFTHPYYREIFHAIGDLGGPTGTTPDALTGKVTDDRARSTVSALSVEPLHLVDAPDARVASAYVVRLRELTALRRIEKVKSRLQRMNPVTEATEYNRLFGELVALESHRRALREQAIGNGL